MQEIFLICVFVWAVFLCFEGRM